MINKNRKKAPELEVKDTHKYGKGLFAKEDIKKGRRIWILEGKELTLNKLVDRLNANKEMIDDPFQIGRKTYMDLNKFSRIFNHSCDPTGGIRNTSELFALRDIKKGEEITYDYSLTISPTDWQMKCKCGSKICRKLLRDIRSVPKKRLKFYEKRGALQKYMKLILREKRKLGYYKIPKYELDALERLKIKHN